WCSKRGRNYPEMRRKKRPAGTGRGAGGPPDSWATTGPIGPVAQGIEQQPSKLKVPGSNPGGVGKVFKYLATISRRVPCRACRNGSHAVPTTYKHRPLLHATWTRHGRIGATSPVEHATSPLEQQCHSWGAIFIDVRSSARVNTAHCAR